MDHGARRMMEEQIDEFYYVTVMNENYAQPSMPKGVEEGILKGLYTLGGCGDAKAETRARLRLGYHRRRSHCGRGFPGKRLRHRQRHLQRHQLPGTCPRCAGMHAPEPNRAGQDAEAVAC
jgi:hypothetical protein